MQGYKIGVMILNWLPFGAAEYMWQWFSKKTTLCYSNMQGPRKGFNLGGHQTLDLSGFAPIIGDQSSGIMVISQGKILKIGLMSDPANIENSKEFMEIMDEKFKEFIYPER